MTTPWTWKEFEAEAQTALEPFEPDYCHLSSFRENAPADDAPVWPDKPPYTRWVAIYAVSGDSEGWYVHIDRIPADATNVRQGMLLAKFWSEEHALKAVETLTRLLWAHDW
jgi:hypothetical protein